MSLSPLTLAQLVQLLAQQYGSKATLPARTDDGSSLGAVFNAIALLAIQQQQQIAYGYSVARLSTIPLNADGSPNGDLDSFVEPFGVTRLGAVASTGQVTISTASPVSAPLSIPLGTVVGTQTGVQFALVADTSQSAYSASANAYVIPTGQSSITATVQCASAGSTGNVQAGQISEFYTGVAGVSSVTNPTAFASGADQESDTALKTRFTLFVSGQRAGGYAAVAAAILGVQANLTYSIGDRLTPTGASQLSYFTVFVNVLGQNAAPSAALLAAVEAAVEAVHAAGISFAVVAPTLLPTAGNATVNVLPGYNASAVGAACTAALTAYLNSVGLSATGAATKAFLGGAYKAIYAVPGVESVDLLTLNGNAADVVSSFGQQIVAGTISVTAVAATF